MNNDNNTKIFIAVIVVLLIAGGLVWFVVKHNKKETVVLTPILSVTSYNETQKIDASNSSAHPQDTIAFTLSAENQNTDVISGYILEVNIADIADKATLIDASGASYNSATNSLVWTPLDIPANQSVDKTFKVRVNPGTANTVITVKFNNEIKVAVAVPPQPKPVVAGTDTTNPAKKTYSAPVTGASGYLVFLLAILTTIAVSLVRKPKKVEN